MLQPHPATLFPRAQRRARRRPHPHRALGPRRADAPVQGATRGHRKEEGLPLLHSALRQHHRGQGRRRARADPPHRDRPLRRPAKPTGNRHRPVRALDGRAPGRGRQRPGRWSTRSVRRDPRAAARCRVGAHGVTLAAERWPVVLQRGPAPLLPRYPDRRRLLPRGPRRGSVRGEGVPRSARTHHPRRHLLHRAKLPQADRDQAPRSPRGGAPDELPPGSHRRGHRERRLPPVLRDSRARRGAHHPRGAGGVELPRTRSLHQDGRPARGAGREPPLSQPPYRGVPEGTGPHRGPFHGDHQDPRGDGGQRIARAGVRDRRRPQLLFDSPAGS